MLYEECTGVNLKRARDAIWSSEYNETYGDINATCWVHEMFHPSNRTSDEALVLPGRLDAPDAAHLIMNSWFGWATEDDVSPPEMAPSRNCSNFYEIVVEFVADHPSWTVDVFDCQLTRRFLFTWVMVLLVLLTFLATASIVAISNRPVTDRITTLRELEISNKEVLFLQVVSGCVAVCQFLVGELLLFLYDFTQPVNVHCKSNPHSFALQAFAAYAIVHATIFTIATLQANEVMTTRMQATQLFSVANGANLFTVLRGEPVLARTRTKGSSTSSGTVVPCLCCAWICSFCFATATRSTKPTDDEEVGFLFEGSFWATPIEGLDGVCASLTTDEHVSVDIRFLMDKTYAIYTTYEETFEVNETVSLSMIRELHNVDSAESVTQACTSEVSQDWRLNKSEDQANPST
jgi:hypothetical protein